MGFLLQPHPSPRTVGKNYFLKKSSEDFILCMTTKYYNHWVCGWVVMAADVQTFVMLVIIWPFYPLSDEGNKIFIKNQKNLEIILLYTCVPNIMITGYVGGWYGFRCTNFYRFGHFLRGFLSPDRLENKIWR